MGHIIRSWELFNCLSSEVSVDFVVLLSRARNIGRAGWSKFCYSAQGFDIAKFIDNKDTIVMDFPAAGFPEVVKSVFKRCHNKKIISLDNNHSYFDKPDIMINLNPSSRKKNPPYKTSRRIYSGLRFAIIRKEFHRLRNILKPRAEKRLLISIGGADIKQYTRRILQGLTKFSQDFKDIKFDVILGPWNKYSRQKKNKKIKFYPCPNNVAKIMSRSSMAVCNAGTTLLECCYLGIPVFVIPQTGREAKFFEIFMAKGVGRLLKIEKGSFPLDILQAINDNQFLAQQKKKAQELVDGKGMQRIKEIILHA